MAAWVKKIAALFFFSAALMCFAACSSLLEAEYFVVSDFKEVVEPEPDVGIDNYSALLRSLVALVDSYTKSDTIIVNNYSGDINTDLGRAYAEVVRTTPIGAYAVEYISYDPSRIVSYYEVGINIVYSRTKEQVESIIRSASTATLRELIREAITSGESVLALNPRSGILGEDKLEKMVLEVYMENPLSLPKAPQLSIKVFPESGIDRVFELSFDYGFSSEDIIIYHGHMQDAVESLLESSGAATLSGRAAAHAIFKVLYDYCETDEQSVSDFSSSAYGALIKKIADSRGIALAFKALCDQAGIPCLVITGSIDSMEHYWNMIEIEGIYYHIDVSAGRIFGDSAFMRGDNYMRERYDWIATDYPASDAV